MQINNDLDELANMMPTVYFLKKDLNSICTDISSNFAHSLGFKNKFAIQGKTDFELPCKASDLAHIFQREDKLTLESKALKQFITIGKYTEGCKVILATKNVLYGKNKNITGLFCYGQDISHTHTHFIKFLHQTSHITDVKQTSFIMDKNFATTTHHNIQLTNRESETLFLLMRGKTVKEVASYLQLSFRTVEQYVEQLRNKFNCKSKSELICSAIEKGFFEFVPPSFLYEKEIYG